MGDFFIEITFGEYENGGMDMYFDKDLTAGKLRRWEKYLGNFTLPDWDTIPDIGLYMEQTVILLKQYLDYLPPELKEDQVVTPAAINNYVRTKIIPEPVKKKYYRLHIAYLIMVCTLKRSLSLSQLQVLIPLDITETELRTIYENFNMRNTAAAQYFISQVRLLASSILDHDTKTEYDVKDTQDLIIFSSMISNFSKLLAEKLIALEGQKDKPEE